MDERPFLNILGELGLRNNEAKCYVALLKGDTLSATEIARLANISRTNAYDALDQLVKRGLCVFKAGASKKFSASDPDIVKEVLSSKQTSDHAKAIESLESSRNDIVKNHQHQMNSITSLIDTIIPVFNNSREERNDLDYIEVLKNPAQQSKRVMQLISDAKSEILAFSRPPFSSYSQEKGEQGEKVKNGYSRGLKLRRIYQIPDSKKEKKELYDSAMEHASEQDQIRVVKHLSMKMLLIDGVYTIFNLAELGPARSSLTMAVLEHPSLTEVLSIAFEAQWKKAKKIDILLD